MVWIWSYPRETADFGAEDYGYDPQPDFKGLVEFARRPIEISTRAIFKSQNSLKRFQSLHAPPTSVTITVDALWKRIIQRFVSSRHIQFLPARIIARGEVCDDFSVMIPFDRVTGIDKHRSDIRRMIENEHGTHIFSIKKLVLVPDCLGDLHLARDKQMDSMLFVSDELKEALAATGQDSPFYSVEEYNERFTWI